jgi:hypothetical protein
MGRNEQIIEVKRSGMTPFRDAPANARVRIARIVHLHPCLDHPVPGRTMNSRSTPLHPAAEAPH